MSLKRSSFTLLIALLVLAYAQGGYSQAFEKKGNIVTYRGNKFEYPKVGKRDTQTVVDPVTNEEKIVVVERDPIPIKMNSTKIYNTDEVTEKPAPLAEHGLLEMFVLKSLSRDFNKLPDGNYLLYISNVVIDKKGKVVYYEYEGMSSERSKSKIPVNIKTDIDKKIDSLMNKVPAFKPGQAKGSPVITRTDIMVSMFTIIVKKHKATISRGY